MPRCVFERVWCSGLTFSLSLLCTGQHLESLYLCQLALLWSRLPACLCEPTDQEKRFFYPLQTLERQCLTVLSVWLDLPSLLTLRRWSLLHSGTISNDLKEDFMLALNHLDGLDTIICWFMLVRWCLQHLSIISSSRSRFESVLHHINFLFFKCLQNSLFKC